MKRLVLLGEGKGDQKALPILVKRILDNIGGNDALYVDKDVMRIGGPVGLVRWDKQLRRSVDHEWRRYVRLANQRRDCGAVLAVFDGDCATFPAGSVTPFCAVNAAKTMTELAVDTGAGSVFSLAMVFACIEFETWLIAGLAGLHAKSLADGRINLKPNARVPDDGAESHGKRWLEQNTTGYRPSRDQAELARIIDIDHIRQKKLRSYLRLEHAIAELVNAIRSNRPILSPK